MGSNYLRRLILTAVLVLQLDFSYGQCSGSVLSLTAASSPNSIESTNYPSPYPNSESCEWSISLGSSNHVVFYIEAAYLESSYDFLTVYSGSSTSNQLYYSDYNDAPYVGITSSGNALMVRFTSDYSVTYGGFKMYYMGVTSVDSCGQALAASSTSKQLTYIYSSSNSGCQYTITSAAFIQITVVILDGSFNIEEGVNTQTITSAGSVIVSSDNSVTVRASSTGNFVITYEEVSSGSSNIATSTSAPNTECFSTGTQLTATATGKYFSSPYYPGSYPNYHYCWVSIVAENADDSIFIFFNDFEIAYGDYLRMYDGPGEYYNTFSGITPGASYTSSGSTVRLLFTTNSYGQNRGFLIMYNSTARVNPVNLDVSTVGYSLNNSYTASGSQMLLTSPNYPNYYANNINVYWLITKPNQDDNIVLEFRDFHVEDALDCVYDKVTLYDGYLASDPILAEVCGSETTYVEDNSGLYILVNFITDGSVTYTGFELVFYIGSRTSTGASEEEDSGLPVYVYPIIVISVILIAAFVAFACFVMQHRKSRVAAGKEVPPKPILQKRTTQQLLTELTSKYGANSNKPKQKVSRKRPGYHPQPNVAGPGVNVIHMGTGTPHPPPNPQPYGQNDPVYPPMFLGSDLNQPPGNVTPVYTNIPQTAPTAPVHDWSNPPCIPPPFSYTTPAEVRANASYS